MPMITVKLGIGYPGATHSDTIEIDNAEWENCETDEEREKLINEYAVEWAWNYIDLSAEIDE